MIVQGVQYMVLGMSVVFLFLILLVLVLKISSFLLKKLERFLPLEAAAEGGADSEGQRIAAAIGAAFAFMKNNTQSEDH